MSERSLQQLKDGILKHLYDHEMVSLWEEIGDCDTNREDKDFRPNRNSNGLSFDVSDPILHKIREYGFKTRTNLIRSYPAGRYIIDPSSIYSLVISFSSLVVSSLHLSSIHTSIFISINFVRILTEAVIVSRIGASVIDLP